MYWGGRWESRIEGEACIAGIVGFRGMEWEGDRAGHKEMGEKGIVDGEGESLLSTPRNGSRGLREVDGGRGRGGVVGLLITTSVPRFPRVN